MAFNEQFAKAVRSSISIAQILRRIGRANTGSNYVFVHKLVRRLGLDTHHWKGKRHGTTKLPKVPWSKVLVENSPYHLTAKRRNRLIKEGLLVHICAICGLKPVWNGKPLVLRLDHKNGKRQDHRLKNLRFVCPNCDSQLPTFCGRNCSRARMDMEESLKLRNVGSIPTESTSFVGDRRGIYT